MSNIVQDINIENHRQYFFNDIISIKDIDQNNIKIDEKLNKNILIYYIAYVTIKDSKQVQINRINSLHLLFSEMNEQFEEINENKYLTLAPTNKSTKKKKKKKKNQKSMKIKIRYLIKSVTEKVDDYDEKYIKMKPDSEDKLPLNETIEILVIVIVVRVIF